MHISFYENAQFDLLIILAALIGGILPLSGYYLWLKKRFSGRRPGKT